MISRNLYQFVPRAYLHFAHTVPLSSPRHYAILSKKYRESVKSIFPPIDRGGGIDEMLCRILNVIVQFTRDICMDFKLATLVRLNVVSYLLKLSRVSVSHMVGWLELLIKSNNFGRRRFYELANVFHTSSKCHYS